MKKILALIFAGFTCASTTHATINGFTWSLPSASYTVPSTNILVIESVDFPPTTPTGQLYFNINNGNNTSAVYFNNVITNGFYTLPKPILVPAGTVLNGFANIMGALIAPSDAPLFVGVGSSVTNLVVTGNTLNGVLQLSRSAVHPRVLFQSTTNLLTDWSFDTSVMVLPGANYTQRQFTVPIADTQRFYRALVLRQYGG